MRSIFVIILFTSKCLNVSSTEINFLFSNEIWDTSVRSATAENTFLMNGC
jgi:hypothetical protein